MAITPAQKAAAEQQQWNAARDASPQVRLVAGPGTGKSKTIEKRVAHVLNAGATPQNVYVISFTVAASTELRKRITAYCANQPCAQAAVAVRVSTMHSLALRILRSANLLATLYPANPAVLDDWERRHVYDIELANSLGCTPGRAAEIRAAHDAAWQTLNPNFINQAAITPVEVQGFNVFHPARTNLYCCVLPGEVIYRCVEAIRMGQIQPAQLPTIEHLIVDEFQDLNACDQEFVRYLANRGAVLFVAGDDDQSIYSFRHADPTGLVQFTTAYSHSSTHVLTDCFRSTPQILGPATQMISVNPNRIPKNLVSLYHNAAPPVGGSLCVWSFPSEQDEARAIAASCQELINAGMAGQEDGILVLISDRGLQLQLIAQELGNLGLPYDPPPGEALTDVDPIRAVYSALRIARDIGTGEPDYVAHRALLGLLSGVGPGTARAVADACVANNQNFHDLFYLAAPPPWLPTRSANAVIRVTAMIQAVSTWNLADTLTNRAGDVAQLLGMVFQGSAQAANHIATWNALAGALPGDMTLQELLSFFEADNDADRRSILDSVNQRLGAAQTPPPTFVQQKRIRILTMHGAKGLSGKVVFIPSLEQGIMPSFRALQAAGLVIEQRRLFYVSVTRAMAACIITHAAQHTGPSAFRLQQRPTVMLPRSQYLNEMNVPSVNRNGGLTPAEAAQIVADVNNL
jgi:DNA helicase-2/ATP-dependent DNA helicase PcrA